jgi:hypothetical protein
VAIRGIGGHRPSTGWVAKWDRWPSGTGYPAYCICRYLSSSDHHRHNFKMQPTAKSGLSPSRSSSCRRTNQSPPSCNNLSLDTPGLNTLRNTFLFSLHFPRLQVNFFNTKKWQRGKGETVEKNRDLIIYNLR